MATRHSAKGEIVGRVVEIKTRDAGTRKLVDVLLEKLTPAKGKYPEKVEYIPTQCWDLDTFCGEEATVIVGDTIQATFYLGAWAKQGDKGTWYNLQCTLQPPLTILERAQRGTPAPEPPKAPQASRQAPPPFPAQEAAAPRPPPPADDGEPVDDIPF